MSTKDPAPIVGFTTGAKTSLSKWTLATIELTLLIIHVAIIYVVFIVIDFLLLAVMGWAFSEIIKQISFVQYALDGIKIFSVIGVGATYALHTTYVLYIEGRHVAKVIREGGTAGSDTENVS